MDEVEPAGSPDAPRLSPGEIAYREFTRTGGGYDEHEVRAFLGVIADVVAAGRDRELRLEERLAELEAPPASADGASSPSPPPHGRAEALFAQLRATDADAEEAPKPPRAKKARKKERPTDDAGPAASSSEPSPEPSADREATPGEPVAESQDQTEEVAPAAEPTPDDRLRDRRDAVLEPLVADVVRTSKRLLQDEQNVLLDAARRAKTRVDPAKLLPDPERHREVWAALLSPAFDSAYGGGRSAGAKARKPSSAPERVVNELTASLIAPLRERLIATLGSVVSQGPYESSAELHRELASAVSARFREWRSTDLEKSLGDVLAAAYARGAYDSAASGSQLRWISHPTLRCPDCEDNSLEPTVKGQHFPTGQAHPPAHPGCRCLVVELEGDRKAASTSP